MLLGNNKACEVARIGTVKIKMCDGVERVLQGVRHIPELKKNLISIGMLDSYGFFYKEEGRILKVFKGSLVKDNDLSFLLGSTMIK